MKKIITVIGARPQIIKAAAISRCIRNQFTDQLQEVLLHTGQHFDDNMSGAFFDELEIPQPKYNLHIQSSLHGDQTAQMLIGIEEKIEIEKPDAVLLYGDTNSTLAGALAASKVHVPIIHVEAGLRSFNKSMPEEINRIVADHCSSLLFSPTPTGIDNLKNEGFDFEQKTPYSVDKPGVFLCGDIMLDNSLYFAKKTGIDFRKQHAIEPNNYFLATIHRPQNTDNPERLEAIFEALMEIAQEEKITFVLPLHPRTEHRLKEFHTELWQKVNSVSYVKILPPTSFLEMIALESNARFIATDSGGVQKEAFFFKKPALILRSETEWVEICDQNNALLVDADKNRIKKGIHWMKNEMNKEYKPIFGDGDASVFICNEIVKFLNQPK